jgi:hypothetical protein
MSKKMSKKISNALILMLLFSCERHYEAPPLNEPIYNGIANISVGGLKERYVGTTTPVLINTKLTLGGVVTSSDKSGNIYKQIYIQDSTGGINIGIDQNSIYASCRVGQEIYIDLEGLYMLAYGDELQIGYGGTQSNRIPWDIFLQHSYLNGWPNVAAATPKMVTLNSLTDRMVNTLVTVNEVYFVNGGIHDFTTGDVTTNEPIMDLNGNSIDVRTSSFCDFASNKLPEGTGSVTGILGRYRGAWQLLPRDRNDVVTFGDGSSSRPSDEVGEIIFGETFGTGSHPSGNRPKIADFTGFDMKSPVIYSDTSGFADIRSISGGNGAHVWLPANRNTYLTVSGINTAGKHKLALSYQLAANLIDAGSSVGLDAVSVSVNGTRMPVPAITLYESTGDSNRFYTIEFYIGESEELTLEFFSAYDKNTTGFRLDNIKITAENPDEVIILYPSDTSN